MAYTTDRTILSERSYHKPTLRKMNEPVALLNPKELQDRVQEGVEAALTKILSREIRKATTKPYLTKSELMQLTGWSSRQIEYKKSGREIPFLRRGRTILFPTDEIYEYLEGGRVDVRIAG